MPPAGVVRMDFNSFHVTYAVTNPSGKDYLRIDFFDGDTKVGQALLGDAIAPGSFAAVTGGNEIHLYFPSSQFANLLSLLRSEKRLALFAEHDQCGCDYARTTRAAGLRVPRPRRLWGGRFSARANGRARSARLPPAQHHDPGANRRV
jgi:hypothetical protein